MSDYMAQQMDDQITGAISENEKLLDRIAALEAELKAANERVDVATEMAICVVREVRYGLAAGSSSLSNADFEITYGRSLCDAIEEKLSALQSSDAAKVVEQAQRWRMVEHGMRYVQLQECVPNGDFHSFDPRNVDDLKRLRTFVDEATERHLAVIRGAIDQARKDAARKP